MIKAVLLALIAAFHLQIHAQTIEILSKKEKLSLRGLSVVNNEIFWVSGTGGAVGRSIDAGKNIEWITVPGYEKRDFRDVEAFDGNTAIVMAIDNPAIILKTDDGGHTWVKVYENEIKGMFLDAMAFSGAHGACVGDPIDGRLWTIETFDTGNTWKETPFELRPKAPEGEAIFAASGSNIQFLKKDKKYSWAFVTGGKTSSLIKIAGDSKTVPKIEPLAMQKGKESTGAFSWAIDGKKLIAVGGDYVMPAQDSGNHIFSGNGGKTWQSFPGSLQGFKSCVIWDTPTSLVACGTSGVAVAKNIDIIKAIQWENRSSLPFHVVQKAKNGKAVYLAGADGLVGRLK